MHRKRISPIEMKICGVGVGYRNHIARARNRPRTGAAENGIKLAGDGETCSFKNNFKASASGCGSPINITLFGPFRS